MKLRFVQPARRRSERAVLLAALLCMGLAAACDGALRAGGSFKAQVSLALADVAGELQDRGELTQRSANAVRAVYNRFKDDPQYRSSMTIMELERFCQAVDGAAGKGQLNEEWKEQLLRLRRAVDDALAMDRAE